MLARGHSHGIGIRAKAWCRGWRVRSASLASMAAMLALACSAATERNGTTRSSGGRGGEEQGGDSSSGAGGASGSGYSGAGGAAGASSGGTAGTAGGSAGGTAGAAGSLDGGGVDPSQMNLTAIAANGTIGLEWAQVAGASAYRLYWSNTGGVTPENATLIDNVQPGFVHRGLTNGTAYHYVVAAILATSDSQPSNEASATPSGEWVLEQLGTGDFDDVLTGARVPTVPIDKRVHIVLLPEGYLDTDLTIFHNDTSHNGDRKDDVDRRIDEVFGIEPYPLFREAFVIWYLPRASSTHSDGGNTAFGVTVSGGSVGDTSQAAAPLWTALAAHPFPPPSGSFVNYISAFLMFDSARGRAGVSGLTTSLSNPSSSGQRIPASFRNRPCARVHSRLLRRGGRISRGRQHSARPKRHLQRLLEQQVHGPALAASSRRRRDQHDAGSGRRLRPAPSGLPFGTTLPDERHARQRRVLLPGQCRRRLRRASPCAWTTACAISAARSPPTACSIAAAFWRHSTRGRRSTARASTSGSDSRFPAPLRRR